MTPYGIGERGSALCSVGEIRYQASIHSVDCGARVGMWISGWGSVFMAVYTCGTTVWRGGRCETLGGTISKIAAASGIRNMAVVTGISAKGTERCGTFFISSKESRQAVPFGAPSAPSTVPSAPSALPRARSRVGLSPSVSPSAPCMNLGIFTTTSGAHSPLQLSRMALAKIRVQQIRDR